jgi:UPF0755 protein
VTQRERESLAPDPVGGRDPHAFLFGDDDDDDVDLPPVRLTRADRRSSDSGRRRRTHRRGRLFVLLAAVLVAGVAVLVVPRVLNHFKVADYSGTGIGSVTISIPTGASAGDIADRLVKADVVKSATAFTRAARDNSKSQSIQPGVYNLRRHMSGSAALSALLDPGSRNATSDVVVREGATSLDVIAEMVTVCGAKHGAVVAALQAPADLGIPVTYKVGSKVPTSAEGFLYPATYTPDSCANAGEVLQRMVSRFISQDRDTGFATDATKLNLTPYQALIIASIAQSEAKYATDMPKVVRTILNRIAGRTPLQFDSTSSYACKLSGQNNCIYDKVSGPYNTYRHRGLPPTPIDNPGAEAMKAAVHPASGNWLYFVNQDKAGHLFFTSDEKAFEKAAEKCAANHWGCG